MIQFKENYRVAGIFDVGIYEYNNVYAFINIDDFLTSLEANNKRDIYIKTIRIKLPDPLKSKLFTYKFNREIDGYYTQDWSYTHESLFSAINNEKRVMFIILMLIIAIAAFNIVSSLLMLVTNKQKEIAILVTLGATRFDIITIFLLQGLFLGSIGIFFGVLLGFLLANNIDVIISSIEIFFKINLMPAEIYHLNKIPSLINHDDIIFIVIYTFLLTLVSAIYPAIKASRIKPAKIFRGNN
jgi:lipoprotein-releasing system permease protein